MMRVLLHLRAIARLILLRESRVIADGEAAASLLKAGIDDALAGRRDEARATFQRAISLDPAGASAPKAHQQLGQMFFTDFRGGSADALEMAEWHFAQHFEADVPGSLIRWYNFRGGEVVELEARLRREKAAIAAIPLPSQSHSLLVRHLELLRARERDPAWLGAHLVGCHALVVQTGLAPDACSYAAFWADSLLQVLQTPAIVRALSATAPRVVVLGSALGEQCASVVAWAPAARCLGYELLCGMAADARQLWEEAVAGNGSPERVRFECRDALGQEPWWDEGFWGGEPSEADASPLFIWANDYAWGEEAREVLLRKATQEAGPGAVLVLPRLGATPAGWNRAMDLEVDVSWHSALAVTVLERRIVSDARMNLDL